MATFINTPDEIIKVYYLVTSRQEQYVYDVIGNRTSETITQKNPVSIQYSYYPNSSRLKSNEKYNFEYDANGKLTKKSTINGDIVWNYEYDLLNRLVKVAKNNEDVASYVYDESGLRLKKQGTDTAIYYVFDIGGNVLYEQENREYLEYIYVLGKHFARVDGNLDNLGDRTKYFYHTDHLGSTVAVTDEAGQTVWASEYTPFGGKHSIEGELDRAAKFTGKDLDQDIGLYYYNARWYDQEIGRFVTEDPIQNGLNWYIYCNNNPILYIDPSGKAELLYNDGKYYYIPEYRLKRIIDAAYDWIPFGSLLNKGMDKVLNVYDMNNKRNIDTTVNTILDFFSNKNVQKTLSDIYKYSEYLSEGAGLISLLTNIESSADALSRPTSEVEVAISLLNVLKDENKDLIIAVTPFVEKEVNHLIESKKITIELDWLGYGLKKWDYDIGAIIQLRDAIDKLRNDYYFLNNTTSSFYQFDDFRQ